MQLRKSVLLAICIILFIYFEIHSCSKDDISGPNGKTPPVESIICSATDVYFIDADFGCVTGALGTFMVTGDGGRTWKGSVIDEGILNDIQFLDRSKGWVVGKDGALYRTSDAGSTWTDVIPSGFPIGEDFFKLHFVTENLGYVLGYRGVYKTENSGLSWENNWLPLVPYRGAWDMSFVDESVGYILGSRYTDPDPVILYRTTNGATSWFPVEESKASVLRTILTIYFVDAATGWAGGGVIMRTTDGGKSWQTQVALATVREFHFLTDRYGFAAGGKTILRTRDAGETWENVSPPDQRITDLRSVHFIDEDNGWVVGRGQDERVGDLYYKRSIILRTTDGGASWTIRDFLYDYTKFQTMEDAANP